MAVRLMINSKAYAMTFKCGTGMRRPQASPRQVPVTTATAAPTPAGHEGTMLRSKASSNMAPESARPAR